MYVEKLFERRLAILPSLAPYEIMRLINGFIEFKKEFWLSQALVVLKHSASVNM